MESKRRKRSQNWDSTDKILLQELIKEKYHIIENKNVDTNTSKMKRDAWNQILESFNQASTLPRNIAQIQCQWRGTKMQAKMHKRSLKATGGPLKSPSREDKELLALIPEEVEMDFNPYDCDSTAQNVTHFNEEDMESSCEGSTDCSSVVFEIPFQMSPKVAPETPQTNTKSSLNNHSATMEAMKQDIFELTKRGKELEIEYGRIEHRKRMEILQMELQNKIKEDERREKEHLIRMEMLLKKDPKPYLCTGLADVLSNIYKPHCWTK